MKKYLTTFLLLCVGFIPALANAGSSDICYQYAPSAKQDLIQTATKFFVDDGDEKAFDYFLDKMNESKAVTGIPGITCGQIVEVCLVAKWSGAKCENFGKELITLWKKTADNNTLKTKSNTYQEGDKTVTEVEHHFVIREFWRVFDENDNEIDICTINDAQTIDIIVKNFNHIEPRTAWNNWQNCLTSFGYSFDGDKITKNVARKSGKMEATSDVCKGMNEQTIQQMCDRYNETVKNRNIAGSTYSLEYGTYGECYEAYGYSLSAFGCKKS